MGRGMGKRDGVRDTGRWGQGMGGKISSNAMRGAQEEEGHQDSGL